MIGPNGSKSCSMLPVLLLAVPPIHRDGKTTQEFCFDRMLKSCYIKQVYVGNAIFFIVFYLKFNFSSLILSPDYLKMLNKRALG